MAKIFLTVEQAVDLLPEGEEVHTFKQTAFGMLGCDWSRDEVIGKIQNSECREVTGYQARTMRHGLALYQKDAKYVKDILFVETDMEKLDRLYPPEEDHED